MYGKGQVTIHPDQAATWMKQVQADVKQWQTRALKGLAVLRSQENVDPQHLAAIGYCFGGATVLQLGYSGADVKGVVSFHGALPLPAGPHAQSAKAKILIAHGNADPFLKRRTRSQVSTRIGCREPRLAHGGIRRGTAQFHQPRCGCPRHRRLEVRSTSRRAVLETHATLFWRTLSGPPSGCLTRPEAIAHLNRLNPSAPCPHGFI